MRSPPDRGSGSEPLQRGTPLFELRQGFRPLSVQTRALAVAAERQQRNYPSLGHAFGNNLNPHHHFCILLRFLKSVDRELAKD